ncbi:RlpA-like double-psi beta-barrel-protein domain-containing protein-containing protein [Mycena metata]|uniref:RlpA-like double-psi beta-barrel-protein domain-containing protein-containing protein n=1 Tax=Mycena metata TaxID=1033252 RepID=A0AAD7IWS3_9AGAR|nr:RlpA-like double-psi beta-barrel-protein domain-containing protein-containing protein [Mycena metata]
MTSTILLLLVLGLVHASRAANWNRTLEKRFSDARFTFFDAGLGACGSTSDASQFIVALNSQQYGDGENCYKMIEITYNGKTAQAQIVDECTSCPYGALDFSTSLFDHFASEDLGVIYGSWVFADAAKPTTTTRKKTTTTQHTTATTFTTTHAITTTSNSVETITSSVETTSSSSVETPSSSFDTKSSSSQAVDATSTSSGTASATWSTTSTGTPPSTPPSIPTIAGALGTEGQPSRGTRHRIEVLWLAIGVMVIAGQ